MKRFIPIICIIVILVVLSLVGFQYKFVKNLYPTTMVVTEVDYKTDIVTMEDFNGNIWQFEGTEDWMTGDIVGCIMDSKGTDLIYDDEIVKIRYTGYFEECF